MTRVFISHSSLDREFVERNIILPLRTEGVETWYSKDSIETADEWARKISEGLKSCDWFLVALTPRSVKSKWVQREVHWAIERREGRVIPVMVEECESEDLHLGLFTLQYIDFRQGIEQAQKKLIAIWRLDQARAEEASSFPGEGDKPREGRFWFHFRWGRIALIVASLLVTAASIVLWRTTFERPAAKSSTNPTSTNPNPTSPGTTNSSLLNMARTRTNQAGIDFVLIPPGSFMMVSNNGYAPEKPVHQVTISQPFYMGKYEVTQAQWEAFMGNKPGHFKDCGGNCPIEQVSWDDAQGFIQKLNQTNDGYIYRLPTEAEWEYACRAGTAGDYAGDVKEMAWFKENSADRPHAVGQKQPNGWGLADMHGNVWEWCEDWYHETYYGAPTDGSAWLSGGEQKYRVLRGGSWDSVANYLRSAIRNLNYPDNRYDYVGFRVVAVVRTQ